MGDSMDSTDIPARKKRSWWVSALAPINLMITVGMIVVAMSVSVGAQQTSDKYRDMDISNFKSRLEILDKERLENRRSLDLEQASQNTRVTIVEEKTKVLESRTIQLEQHEQARDVTLSAINQNIAVMNAQLVEINKNITRMSDKIDGKTPSGGN